MGSSKIRWFALVACFVFCPLSARAQTPDANRLWTTVGSDGTVDEASTGKVFFDRGMVQRGRSLVVGSKTSAAPAAAPAPAAGVQPTDSAVVRYNVTAVDGLFTSGGLLMKIRFLDEGSGARVVAKLIEVDLATGGEVTRLTFDSNAPGVPALRGYHVHEVADCSQSGGRIDFVRKAYYIEGTLTSSSIIVGSAAGIQMIQLGKVPCIT
ncbi:MAG TPA: hypothetical protein VF883_02485 [Thermoanaerobaculia bacterium]|jgi:hypothetical protein